MVQLYSKKVVHTIVAHEVHSAINDQAKEVSKVAEARLAAHRKTGSHEITVTEGEVDSFVNLDGPSPESVEFGHWVEGKYKTDPPKFAQGLYILTGSADLDTTPKQTVRQSGR